MRNPMYYIAAAAILAMVVILTISVSMGDTLIERAYNDPSRSLDVIQDCSKTLHYGYASDYTKCSR